MVVHVLMNPVSFKENAIPQLYSKQAPNSFVLRSQSFRLQAYNSIKLCTKCKHRTHKQSKHDIDHILSSSKMNRPFITNKVALKYTQKKKEK